MLNSDKTAALKNLNLTKGLFLSKKQRKLRLECENIEDIVWASEHIICLIHKTVHIKVNLNTEIFYDISKISLTMNALKLKEIDEEILTVSVELCNDAVQLQHNITNKGVR